MLIFHTLGVKVFQWGVLKPFTFLKSAAQLSIGQKVFR